MELQQKIMEHSQSAYQPQDNRRWYRHPSMPGAPSSQNHPIEGALIPPTGMPVPLHLPQPMRSGTMPSQNPPARALTPVRSHQPQPMHSAQHDARGIYYHPINPVYSTDDSGNRISPRSQHHAHGTGRSNWNDLPIIPQPTVDHHGSDDEEFPTARRVLELTGRSAHTDASSEITAPNEVGASAGKQARVRKPKATGKGNQSGTNRRAQGNSDEELEKLSAKKSEEVCATGKDFWSEEDKIKAIKFICELE